MKRNTQTGLHLQRAHSGSEGSGRALLAGWLLLMGWCCLLHTAVGTADRVWLALPAVGTAVFALWAVLLWRKKDRWAVVGTLGVACLLALCCMSAMTGGLKLVLHSAGTRWTAALGRLILTPAVTEMAVWETAVFYGICAVLLAALCRAGSLRLPRTLAILLAAASAALAWYLPEQGLWLLPALVAAAVILLLGGADSRSAACARGISAAAVLAVLVGVCLLVAPVRDGSWFEMLRRDAEKSAHALCYEKGFALPEGDFSEPVTDPDGEETVLRVTAAQPETLYLRGFVGDTFDGTCWQAAEEAAAEQAELFYWLHREDFWPQSQLSESMDQLEHNTVTVENVAACSAYVYAPFNLDSQPGTDPARLLPGTWKATGLNGQRSYGYTTVYDPAGTIADAVEQLRTDGDAAYLSREGSYRRFVLEQDLQLPDGGMTAMLSALDACAALYGGRESLSMEQAEACVLVFLQKYLAEGELTLPLDHTAGNTVFQTATATVLALRYFGIPARYAEGYLIQEDQLTAGEVTEVPANWGTAWAEVYQDGVGWIPLAMTPGMQAISGQVADSLEALHGGGLEAGEGDAVLPEGKELEPEDEEPEDSPSEENAQRTPHVTLAKRLLIWLLPVLAILLAVAAVWLRRYLILKKRRALLEQEDDRQALCCLFADAARLLEYLGLGRNGGSMLALCTPERLPEEEMRKLLEQAIWLNSRAMFSSHPISGEQRQQMAAFHDLALGQLKQSSSRRKRLILQWVRCAY